MFVRGIINDGKGQSIIETIYIIGALVLSLSTMLAVISP